MATTAGFNIAMNRPPPREGPPRLADYDGLQDFAISTFGDTVRPIKIGNVYTQSRKETVKTMVEAKLGITINLEAAEKFKKAKTQRLLDVWLFEVGVLAWEDIGARGWFCHWSTMRLWERFLQVYVFGHIPEPDYDEKEIRVWWKTLYVFSEARKFLKKDLEKHIASRDSAQPEPSRTLVPTAQLDPTRTPGRGLFKMPSELRLTIYELVVQDPINKERKVYIFPTDPRAGKPATRACKQGREPGLMRVCRGMREEAMPVYYKAQHIVSVLAPLFPDRAGFIEKDTIRHLEPALSFIGNMDLLHRFNYPAQVSHPSEDEKKPHYGTVMVVLRLRGRTFSTLAYVDGALDNLAQRADSCCDGSSIPQVRSGVAAMEKVFLQAMGDRVIKKTGETEFKWLGFNRMANSQVRLEWQDVLDVTEC